MSPSVQPSNPDMRVNWSLPIYVRSPNPRDVPLPVFSDTRNKIASSKLDQSTVKGGDRGTPKNGFLSSTNLFRGGTKSTDICMRKEKIDNEPGGNEPMGCTTSSSRMSAASSTSAAKSESPSLRAPTVSKRILSKEGVSTKMLDSSKRNLNLNTDAAKNSTTRPAPSMNGIGGQLAVRMSAALSLQGKCDLNNNSANDAGKSRLEILATKQSRHASSGSGNISDCSTIAESEESDTDSPSNSNSGVEDEIIMSPSEGKKSSFQFNELAPEFVPSSSYGRQYDEHLNFGAARNFSADAKSEEVMIGADRGALSSGGRCVMSISRAAKLTTVSRMANQKLAAVAVIGDDELNLRSSWRMGDKRPLPGDEGDYDNDDASFSLLSRFPFLFGPTADEDGSSISRISSHGEFGSRSITASDNSSCQDMDCVTTLFQRAAQRQQKHNTLEANTNGLPAVENQLPLRFLSDAKLQNPDFHPSSRDSSKMPIVRNSIFRLFSRDCEQQPPPMFQRNSDSTATEVLKVLIGVPAVAALQPTETLGLF